MTDQAEQLRSLVQAAPTVGAKPQAVGMPLVVVTGCRAGVGATTVAANIGAVLADQGARVLIVDAAGERSNMTEIVGLRSRGEFALADVLEGKCEAADAIVAGPAGVKLLLALEGKSARRESATSARRIVDRRDAATVEHKSLMSALKPLRGAFDVIVIDAGAGLSPAAQRLWLRAPLVVLTTTSDDAAVMDAYAAVKRHVISARGATCENIRVLVNRAENDRAAADAHRRLAKCCQRFLRQNVAALPALPRSEDCEVASVGRHPRVWESPNSEFGHAVMWLGRAIGDVLETTLRAVETKSQPPRHTARR
jgi:flagellar biosynthesis protein FlhG